ncbi:MAG: PhoH family protein [Gammaproteobacteria bacterium]|nr:PhoH family protein [Gammaproteobacteria bacterium]
MSASASPITFELVPPDNGRLAALCGELNGHLRQIEERLQVRIANRGNVFSVSGEQAAQAARVLRELYEDASDISLSPSDVHLALQQVRGEQAEPESDEAAAGIRTRKRLVRPRNPRQGQYLRNIVSHDINFGVGPAGTGKTYLAVACASEALDQQRVARIILVRPAVEAGERLGFLPGDLEQKVDPYLRPLYDALYEMQGFDRVGRLQDRGVIEIAPLAYMRGRTLNEAFIILDEAQNTTVEQMKMFLTRIGFGSTAVITGDITQTDLPRGQTSGLRHAIEVLRDLNGISQTRFHSSDVVRHPLVQRIVEAYEEYESETGDGHQGR